MYVCTQCVEKIFVSKILILLIYIRIGNVYYACNFLPYFVARYGHNYQHYSFDCSGNVKTGSKSPYVFSIVLIQCMNIIRLLVTLDKIDGILEKVWFPIFNVSLLSCTINVPLVLLICNEPIKISDKNSNNVY